MSDDRDGAEPTVRIDDSWDPLEEQRALSEVSANLFDLPPPKVVLGRYVLLERIGRGGGGVVYSAYDPELHRHVALKVLRPDAGTGPDWAQRMRNEAQAIARLSHPNIVAVYDVGDIPAGHPQFAAGVFIVMELIEGEQLTTWLERPHPWREVVDALLPIGRALMAAHAAGLVHRDVKPGNTLIGRDGRARLVDFGLARALLEPPATEQGADGPAFTTSVIGTPSTMAPEQHLGEKADARTDQYGFCATLHATLHGCYPFAGDDLASLLNAKLRDKPLVRVRGVPRWLNEAVSRGLASEPAARFPDMPTLLAKLERGRGRARRWLVSSTLVAAATVIAGIAWWSAGRAPRSSCVEQGERRIDELWGPQARAAALAGLGATGLENAAETAQIVDATVDDVLARWRVAHASACDRAFSTRDEAAEISASRLACLDHALDEVAELGDLLRTADEQVVLGAANAARQMARPEDCEVAAPSERTEPALEVALRRARLHLVAGMYESAEQLANDALARAVELGDDRSQARAQYGLCRVFADTGRNPAGVAACEESVLAAERAEDRYLVVRGLLQLVRVTRNSNAAEWSYRLAEARLHRLPEGERKRGLQSELAMSLARIRADEHRDAESVVALTQAIALIEALRGADSEELVAPLNQRGIAYRRLGKLASATEDYARALELTQRAYGDHHASIGLVLTNLAGVELLRGNSEHALILLDRALRIKQASFGAESPRLVSTLGAIARANLALERREAALAPATRGISIARTAGHESIGDALVTLALVLHANGRCAEAQPLLVDAESRLDHNDDGLATLHHVRGLCAIDSRDPAAARAALTTAIERMSANHGEAALGLVEPLLDLAELERQQGATDRARAAAARAQTIAANSEGDPRLGPRAEQAVRAFESTTVDSRQPIP